MENTKSEKEFTTRVWPLYIKTVFEIKEKEHLTDNDLIESIRNMVSDDPIQRTQKQDPFIKTHSKYEFVVCLYP